MEIVSAFNLVTNHLIEIMGVILAVALVFRYLAYASGKRDEVYFGTFSKTIEKVIEGDSNQGEIKDVSAWMDNLLDRVLRELPDRSVRSVKSRGSNETHRFRHHKDKAQSLKQFAEGKRSIVHSLKVESDAFKSTFPPNYNVLVERVLNQDQHWRNVAGVIPTDTLSRMLEILPGLFIVGGIFGTFIGITSALPMIADIDLNNLETAGPVINSFLAAVAYSMHTSIAGIVYSTVLTLLNTAYPIEAMREGVVSHLERSLQMIWNRIHGGEVGVGEAKVIKLLEELNKTMSKKAA